MKELSGGILNGPFHDVFSQRRAEALAKAAGALSPFAGSIGSLRYAGAEPSASDGAR